VLIFISNYPGGLCVTAGCVSQRAVRHQAVHLFVCVDDMKCSLCLVPEHVAEAKKGKETMMAVSMVLGC